jgi:hypothetical protein
MHGYVPLCEDHRVEPSPPTPRTAAPMSLTETFNAIRALLLEGPPDHSFRLEIGLYSFPGGASEVTWQCLIARVSRCVYAKSGEELVQVVKAAVTCKATGVEEVRK